MSEKGKLCAWDYQINKDFTDNLKENLADIKTEMAYLKEIEGDWSTAMMKQK